eukprot:RCo045254
MAFPVSSTAGAPGVLNVAYFLLLPDVRQRLGYLDASKLVEVLKVSEEEEEEDDDDKKEKASEEVVPTALLIFKRPLRNSLLRGLLEWNQQRAFAKQPLMSLFEIWHNFCKELREAGFLYEDRSTGGRSYWRHSQDVRAYLVPPTLPLPAPCPPPSAVPMATSP